MEFNIYKIVNFEAYCKTCKHVDICETDEPCNECLTETVNLFSHKPVKWKKGNRKETKDE